MCSRRSTWDRRRRRSTWWAGQSARRIWVARWTPVRTAPHSPLPPTAQRTPHLPLCPPPSSNSNHSTPPRSCPRASSPAHNHSTTTAHSLLPFYIHAPPTRVQYHASTARAYIRWQANRSQTNKQKITPQISYHDPTKVTHDMIINIIIWIKSHFPEGKRKKVKPYLPPPWKVK